MSRVDDIINGMKTSDTKKKKSRVETLIEKSSNGNLKTGVDEQYINAFLHSANDYFSNLSNDFDSIGYNNASSLYENHVSKGAELSKKANTIRVHLNSNKSNLDEETYNDLISTLDKFEERSNIALNKLRNSSQYYSKWDTEEEYNADVEAWNKYYEKWGHYADAEDFEATSASRNFVNPSDEDLSYYDAMMDTKTWRTDASGKMYDAFGNEIPYVADANGIIRHPLENDSRFAVTDPLGLFLSTTEDERETLVYGTQSGKKFETLREGVVNHWEMLKDDEVSLYYSILNKKGQDEALKYLRDTAEKLNSRWGAVRAKEIQGIDNGFIKTLSTGLLGLEAGLDQWSTGVAQIIEGESLPTSGVQYASAEMANSLEGLGKYAYNATVTVGNMLPSILTSKLLGAAGVGTKLAQGVGAVTVGASAGGNAYGQALKEGYGESQAQTYGVLVGASEAALQYLIGGIGSLGGVTDDILLAKTKMIDSSLLRVSAKFGIKLGSEVVEEELQNFLEPAFRTILFGEDYDAPTIDEIVETAIVTALSTGVLEGGSTIATDIAENSQLIGQGKDIMKAEGGIEALREIALDMVKNSPAKTSGNISKLSEKVSGEKVNARTVGKLYQATTDAATEQNKADIVKSLERKGYSAKEADYLADALVTYYTGEALTRKQLKKVESLESEGKILKTAEDVVLNEASTAGQRTANLDRFDLGIANGVGISTNASTTQKNFETKALKNEAAKVLKENNIEVSAEGKTINTKNGDITSIKNIESISESGEINLTIDDGMVVSASDLSFGSEAEALFVANIGKIKLGKKNISTASANAMYQTAMTALKSNPNMTATEAMSLIKGLEESYVFGAYNFGESNLAKSEAVAFAHELDESQRKFAYDLGSQDRASEVEKDQKVIDELKAKANSETPSKTPAKKGNVRFENGVVAKGKLQKKAVSLAKHLARAIGIDIVFYDARTTQNPNGKDANGYYDPKTDTIYLDLQNSWSDSKTIVYTMSHELVHFIKKWSPEKFNTFAKFLMKQYGEHGVDTSKLLNKKMAELGTTDSELAYEEMIADACETMLLDSNAVYKLMELRKTDLELFEKIKLYIHEILNAIRDMYKSLGLNPSSDEAKALLEMQDVLEQIYSMFEEVAVDAAQNYQAVSTLESESVRVSEDGTVVMQMKQYQQTGRATLLKYLTEQYGTKDATDLISTIDNIYNTMKDIKKDETLSVFGNWQDSEVELDENGHPIFTTSINNGDYELNQDFSRVCKKRRQLDFVLNMLAEDPAFEASNLTKQDFVKINKAIKEHGFEIACALCFVDSKRFRQAEWADSFANTWNDILYSVVKDKSKLTPFNFATKTPNIADNGIEIDTSKSVMYRKWSEGKEDVKNRRNYNSFDEMLSKDGDKWLEGNANVRTIATLIRDNPNLRHTFRGADIIASQGFDTIQRLAPGIRSILDGWGGSSVPKPSSNDASYDSSIINMSGYNKETAYAMGGVRMNSFSDFMAHMFFDYCQAFADLAAKELPSQAYTKELIYVRLFGRSGQKINMSGIAAIRDDALPTTERKGVSKAEAEANEKIEKMVAGLDVSRLLEHLNKDIHQLTEADVEQFLDMCDYVWADESINMKHAVLLQTGILYDKLSDSKVEECYELLKAGEIEQALEVAGKANVDTEYAKHCGTIVVGVSDAHIRKLLRDPTVRMVIPYHKSGLNPVIARELRISAYNDYTDVQNTGAYLKGSKSRIKSLKADAIKGYGLKDFSFYDWFGKTIDGKVYDGKTTAEKYIEWCEKGYYDETVGDYVYYTTKKEGYILAKDLHKKLTIVPKFDAFMAEENYYKVLEDFDCYNTISGEHSEQGAVDFLRNGLPSDYKDVLVEALKDEQQVHDDFRDHLDNKGLKEEIMDIVKANGYKPSVKKQAKKSITVPGTNKTLSQTFVDNTLNSFGIESLGNYEQVQEQVFDTLMNEGFFTDTDLRNRLDVNEETGMAIETNKSGIDETFCYENYAVLGRFKKIVKLATIRELPNAIKYGQLIEDDVRNVHGSNKGTKYAYLKYDTQVDGIDVTLKITVRKSLQKNKFWVHSFEAIKNVSGTPADTNEGVKTGLLLADIGDIIHQESTESQENSVKKQLKKDSNRSILANALEGAAQNDVEKNKLAQYKEKISLIESEEQRLAEIQKQLFTKGGVEPENRKALQFEAKQIANRINTYDRQLLNLESTTALKNVLNREKALAMKRQKQKDAEAMRNYKEKVAKTQRELLKRHQESRKKAVEGREKTAMRHKIQKVVSELNQLLLRGTKDKHVMIGLQKVVAEALDAVNMDTVGADDRVAKYNALIAKATDPDVIASLTETRDRIQQQGDKMSDKLTKLKNAYSDIKNSEDPLIANSYDEVIASRLEYVTEKVGNTAIRDMTLEQLEDVYDMYKMVLTTIRNSNKAFKNAKNESIATLGNRVMREVEETGGNKKYVRSALEGIKKFGWNSLKPAYAFKVIGSNTFTDIYNTVRAGEDTWATDVSEARDFYQKETKKYNYDSWDFKAKHSFESTSGKTFDLTLEQIMSLYAYSKREQADLHLRYGGFVFDSSIEITQKSKLGIPQKYKVNTADAHNLSIDTLGEIIGTLTEEQRAFVDEMQDYLSTEMGAKGNEVALEMYGVKLFKDKNYFPLKSAKQFMFEQTETAGEVKIKNAGFSKDTVPKANNPIILNNFTDVWANHVNEMSMYHSFVLPLEDFNRVFNYKTPASDSLASESVKMFLQNAYGDQATQYVKQLLTDLNGGARVDSSADWINKSIGLFKKAGVFASASVVIQQPSALARAWAYVNPKYFAFTKMGIKGHQKVWSEVKKYAPVAIIKEMGRFDTHVGQQTTDWIKSNQYEGIGQKTKAFFTDSAYRDDVLSRAPALADEIAWCYIWNAIKKETKATTKLTEGTEEFLKKCGERFTEVITLTQVYDSVLSRSGHMRSKDTGMKMATAFMAEPSTTVNMLLDAHIQGKRGNKNAAGKIVGGVVSSVILNSILVSLVYAARDDDDDETYTEKYLGSLTTELIDGFNPLTYIPFVKDLWSIGQGYDVERSDMSIYSKLWQSVENLFNDDMSGVDKAVDFAGSVANIFGLPVKNITRDVRAIFNVAEGILSKTPTTGAGIGYAFTDALRNSIPLVGRIFEEDSNSTKLYDAILSGDQAQINRVKGLYKDDKAVESAMRMGLRENDPRIKEAAQARFDGDIAEYTRIVKEIKAEKNFVQDTIVAAVNAEINALSKGDSTDSSDSSKVKSMYKMDDYYAALEGRDEATAYVVKEDLIETDVANGKEREEAEDSFNGKFASYLREEYEEGNLSEYDAQRMLINYGGKSKDEAASKVQYWAFKQEYPDYEDLSEEAVNKYYSEVKPYGISVDVYYDYSKQRSKCKGVDANGDGKTDSGSVKTEVMKVINSLPISRSQKDALYYLNGWSAKTINEAPWH